MSYFGRTCIHDIPNLWGIHVRHTLRIHAISWNAIQTSQISLYICSPSHTRKHRHTNTSSTNHMQWNHTSQCYACYLFSFLVSLPANHNPRTYFWCQELQPSGLTLDPPKRFQPQGLVPYPGATTNWFQELQLFDLFLRSGATTL
jgi:hypothetical protein